MATATKSKKSKKNQVKRTRPLLSADQLKAEEKEYVEKGYRIVKGTLRNRGEDPEQDPKVASKRSVEIECGKRGCHERRRIATSDLHQVQFCEPHTLEDRAARKNEARRKATKAKARPRRSPK